MRFSINSTDASRGLPLRLRVERRIDELELLAGALDEGDRTRQDIHAALATVEGLMTGDLDNLPSMVAADLNRWLERHKHLAEYAVHPYPGRAFAAPRLER